MAREKANGPHTYGQLVSRDPSRPMTSAEWGVKARREADESLAKAQKRLREGEDPDIVWEDYKAELFKSLDEFRELFLEPRD